MAFDPSYPADHQEIHAADFRVQFNGLKELIDAGALTGVVVDGVTTLDAGQPAAVEASLAGTVLHLSFGIPAGAQGEQGPAGADGMNGSDGAPGAPGEVSNAELAGAISGTARNPTSVSTLDTPYSDPEKEELRAAYNALLAALHRAPT